MSMLLMAKAFGIQVGNASRKLVLLKLADNANDKGECWPSYKHIAEQCEISKRSAMNHVEALCEAGYVTKRSRKGVKGNSTNVYVLSLEGEKSAPLDVEGESPALGGETDALGGSENPAPGTSHSSEPATEPKKHDSSSSYPEGFEEVWREYPGREGSNPKNHAYRAYRARLDEGFSADELLAGLRRYAAFCQAKGSVGTGFVMQAKRFFGPSHEFLNNWTVAQTPPDRYGRMGFAQPQAQGSYTPNDTTAPSWMED